MTLEFDVKYCDGEFDRIAFEKTPGAHPNSKRTWADAFLLADRKANQTTILIRQAGSEKWITRKDAAEAILTEIMRRQTEELHAKKS